MVCYKTTQSGGPTRAASRPAPGATPPAPTSPRTRSPACMYVGQKDFDVLPAAGQRGRRARTASGATPASTRRPPGTPTTIGTGLLGWEWDARVDNGREPAGVTTLAALAGERRHPPGRRRRLRPGSASRHMVKYTAAERRARRHDRHQPLELGPRARRLGVGEPDRRSSRRPRTSSWTWACNRRRSLSNLTLNGTRTLLPSDLGPLRDTERDLRAGREDPRRPADAALTALRLLPGAHRRRVATLERSGLLSASPTRAGRLQSGRAPRVGSSSPWRSPLQLQPNTTYVVSVNANTSFAQTARRRSSEPDLLAAPCTRSPTASTARSARRSGPSQSPELPVEQLLRRRGRKRCPGATGTDGQVAGARSDRGRSGKPGASIVLAPRSIRRR